MAEPITLAEAKATLWMDDDNSRDTYITSLIAPARAYVERVSRAQLVAATMTEAFSRWGDYLEIYRRPIASIDSVTYSVSDDPLDDVEYEGFAANLNGFPVRIYPALGGAGFPDLEDGQSITVVYTTGALASTTEEYLTAKQAMLLLIRRWFNEEDIIGKASGDFELVLESLLNSISPVSAY